MAAPSPLAGADPDAGHLLLWVNLLRTPGLSTPASHPTSPHLGGKGILGAEKETDCGSGPAHDAPPAPNAVSLRPPSPAAHTHPFLSRAQLCAQSVLSELDSLSLPHLSSAPKAITTCHKQELPAVSSIS